MLADGEEKRKLHQRDLKMALRQRNGFHTPELRLSFWSLFNSR
jgi:hypothetical protein